MVYSVVVSGGCGTPFGKVAAFGTWLIVVMMTSLWLLSIWPGRPMRVTFTVVKTPAWLANARMLRTRSDQFSSGSGGGEFLGFGFLSLALTSPSGLAKMISLI